MLDDVTRLLPDDTWLTQLEIKTTARGKDSQRELLLRGESANAGRLVTLLEDSQFVHAGGAALADDQDSARARRNLRSGCAIEAVDRRRLRFD